MIRMQREPDGYITPHIYCDVCKHPIETAIAAFVTWDEFIEQGKPSVAFLFVHKGMCDESVKLLSSMELDKFLGFLLLNSGISTGSLESMRTILERMTR